MDELCNPQDPLGMPLVVPDCCFTKTCQSDGDSTGPSNDVCAGKDAYGMPLVVPDCCPDNCEETDYDYNT